MKTPSSSARRFAAAIAALLLALVSAGCATTYVPVSWEYREKARRMAQTEPELKVLYDHCDPKLTTLRFAGESFAEVMMPEEVKHHLGAYRRDTGLIYRNFQYRPSDKELCELLVHEVSHHCWFTTLTQDQRNKWIAHLGDSPSPVQAMVRQVYRNPADYDTEDFAFSIEYTRPVDIETLVKLEVITPQEGQTLLKARRPMPSWQVKKAPLPPAQSPALIDPEVDL